MPLYVKNPKPQTVQTSEQTEVQPEQSVSVETDTNATIQPEQTAHQPIPESTESIIPEQNPPHPQETATKPTITNTTTPNKEKTTMNENINITHTVSAPVQVSAQNREPEKELNPLDELLANIEGMKAKIKVMFDDSVAMARKVREVALSQRQKEREYLQTKRTIERIRTASGF